MENEPVMDWQYFNPPFWFKELGKYVIADRYLPDGTRQHMVEGRVDPGLVFRNAQIIGQDDIAESN